MPSQAPWFKQLLDPPLMVLFREAVELWFLAGGAVWEGYRTFGPQLMVLLPGFLQSG